MPLVVAGLIAGAGAASAGTSRTEAIDRARAYAFYPWRATADNLDAPCDPAYETAYTAGDFLGVAYKWGGFDSLFQFSQKLAGGYGAGTTTYDQVFSCMTGVDCSGFVSRVWNTSSKYGTSTFEQISHEIAASQLLPGDAFNDAGTHCALYSHTLSSGEPYLIEAVYFNTHLNATGGWSYVDGFTAIRYDDITGTEVGNPPGTLSNPIAVDALPFTDSRSTVNAPSDLLDGCAASPGSNESGREVIYRVEVTEPGMLTASVSDDAGADIDVHLYGSSNTSDCLARGDAIFTLAVDCGTYYVVADTFRSSSGDLAGAYDLTIALSPSGGTCEGGAPSYDPLGGPGGACAYPDHPALPFCNPTLGADVCIYTTGEDSTSFCSRACAAGDPCSDIPGGGCCQDIGDGELYCMTGDFCPDAPGDDDQASTPDAGAGTGTDDDVDVDVDGDGHGDGGCAAAGGASGLATTLLALLLLAIRRPRGRTTGGARSRGRRSRRR
jgi:hypothetical protein